MMNSSKNSEGGGRKNLSIVSDRMNLKCGYFLENELCTKKTSHRELLYHVRFVVQQQREELLHRCFFEEDFEL